MKAPPPSLSLSHHFPFFPAYILAQKPIVAFYGLADGVQPLMVNAKQYMRILKRRAAREALDRKRRERAAKRPRTEETGSAKKSYRHESRHQHAMNRPRGPGGRYLTKEELEAYHRDQEAAQAAGDEENSKGENGIIRETTETNSQAETTGLSQTVSEICWAQGGDRTGGISPQQLSKV